MIAIGVNASQVAVDLASVAQSDYLDNQPAVIDRVDHLVSAHRLARAPVLASPISSSVMISSALEPARRFNSSENNR